MSAYESALKSEALNTLKFFQGIDANVSRRTFQLLMVSAVACHTEGATVVQSVFSSDEWKTRGNIAQCASTARVNAPAISLKFADVIGKILTDNDQVSLSEAGQLLAAELSLHGFTALHHFKTYSKDFLSPKQKEAIAANVAKEAADQADKAKEAQERALKAAEARKAKEAAPASASEPEAEPLVEIGADIQPEATPFPVSPLLPAKEPLVAQKPEQAPAPVNVADLIKAFSTLENPEFFEAYNALKAMADERRKAMRKAA